MTTGVTLSKVSRAIVVVYLTDQKSWGNSKWKFLSILIKGAT